MYYKTCKAMKLYFSYKLTRHETVTSVEENNHHRWGSSGKN